MEAIDRKYLWLQFWNEIYQKNATSFQSFFTDIMQEAYPDFQKIRPYGNQGDRGNDGYRPDEGIYYQVYAPETPQEKEAAAARKLKRDFETLKENWDQISKIRKFYFVFNDKGSGVSIEIERSLAELRNANPNIAFDKFTPKDLEDVFFSLKPDQMRALKFDVDTRNSVRIVRESLSKLEIELEKDNVRTVQRSLENLRDIIPGLGDDATLLEFEIIQCRALQRVEKIKEAKRQYENICKRYPNDPRAYLYLAEIHLNHDDFDKNEKALKEAEKVDSSHWLLRLQKLFREIRLGTKIDPARVDEASFPADPRVRSRFYRLYAVLLQGVGDQRGAETFIERALHLNPESIINHTARISISSSRILSETDEEIAQDLLSEIDALQERADEWGGLSTRNQLVLNLNKIHTLIALEKFPRIDKVAKAGFTMIMQCHFDHVVDDLLTEFLSLLVPPKEEFGKLLHYLEGAEKSISDSLARVIIIQFALDGNLFTEGKRFFETTRKKNILEFINHLEKKEYDEVLPALKEDLRFAVAMANSGKQFPELRKKIIESLPDDGNIQRNKLLLLLSYDEKDLDEAFDLLRRMDLSNLRYLECKLILEIAQEKKAWDFVIKVVEKLLKHERNDRVASQLRLQLFAANYNLGKLPEAIRLGEGILSDAHAMLLIDEHNREGLLAQTVLARMRRGDYQEAKLLIERHPTIGKSFEFKVGIEADVYLKSGEPDKALTSVIAGLKVLKTPTPEQYGSLYLFFVEIDNLINLGFAPDPKVEHDRFVKVKEQERWYFIGNDDELDGTKIPSTDDKYPKFLGKAIGEKVVFDQKYRSTTTEYTIENILPIEKYIHWQSTHHAQRLSVEGTWDMMEMIEVPTTEAGIDTKYIVDRLEDERKKRGALFEFYCRENIPLAILALNEGGLRGAIRRITEEGRGFIRFSSGHPTELSRQKEVAKRVISGEPFYIDGTSALVLSEPGLLGKIHGYLPNLKVPQSVITFLMETEGRFRYVPGMAGYMGYSQGKVTFSALDEGDRATIQGSFKDALRILEAKPENITAVSAANKEDSFWEQKIQAELSDACLLAQREMIPVLTEDFLYLQANELETKKKAPEYYSAFALVRELYDQKKIDFEDYLKFFSYLSSLRLRFLPITPDDIEKAVFGDGAVITIQPERIRWFNFSLTLSEEYGVPPAVAFRVVAKVMMNILLQDSIPPQVAERIFVEILSEFPTEKDKRILGKMILERSIKEIKKSRKQ